MAASFKLKQSPSIFGGDTGESQAPALKTPSHTPRPSFLDEDKDNDFSFGFPSSTPSSQQHERTQPQVAEPPSRVNTTRFSLDNNRPRFTLNKTPQHSASTKDTTPPQSPKVPLPQQHSPLPARPSLIPPEPPQDKEQHFPSSSPPGSPRAREPRSSAFPPSSPQPTQSAPSSPPVAMDTDPRANFQSPFSLIHTEDAAPQVEPRRKKFSFTPTASKKIGSFPIRIPTREQQRETPDIGHPSSTTQSHALLERAQISEEQANISNTTSRPPRKFKFTSFKPQQRFENTETESAQDALKESMETEEPGTTETEQRPVEVSPHFGTSTPVESSVIRSLHASKAQEEATSNVPRFPRVMKKVSGYNFAQPKEFHEERSNTHAQGSTTLAVPSRAVIPSRQVPSQSDPRELAFKNINRELKEANLKGFNKFCAATRAELSAINQQTHKELTELHDKLVDISIALAQQTQEMICLRDPVLEHKIAMVERRYRELEKELAKSAEE